MYARLTAARHSPGIVYPLVQTRILPKAGDMPGRDPEIHIYRVKPWRVPPNHNVV